MTNLSDTIAVFGPGLMGGSLLMALRWKSPTTKLAVWARREAALDELRSLNLADTYSTDAAAIAKQADILILCLPVDHMAALATSIANSILPHALVTDVGSVKNTVVSDLEHIFNIHHNFIGSHPMCGSEESGLSAARADLYDNAPCVITPTPQSPPPLISKAITFWESLGAHVVKMSPGLHDHSVAAISHVPHIAAAALVELAMRSDPSCLSLCSSGFRDTTRIASGDASLWTAILSQNRIEAAHSISTLIDILKDFQSAIQNNDTTRIYKLLESAATDRTKIFPLS